MQYAIIGCLDVIEQAWLIKNTIKIYLFKTVSSKLHYLPNTKYHCTLKSAVRAAAI